MKQNDIVTRIEIMLEELVFMEKYGGMYFFKKDDMRYMMKPIDNPIQGIRPIKYKVMLVYEMYEIYIPPKSKKNN